MTSLRIFIVNKRFCFTLELNDYPVKFSGEVSECNNKRIIKIGRSLPKDGVDVLF